LNPHTVSDSVVKETYGAYSAAELQTVHQESLVPCLAVYAITEKSIC